jgi:hypothetical protein
MLKYIVFDLDETLLNKNSQYFFADSFFKEKSRAFYIIYKIFSRGIFGKFIFFIKKDDARRIVSTFLFGFFSNADLYNYAKDIFIHWEQMTNPKIYSFFKICKRKKGYEIIIATATLDFIASVFSELTGIRTVSSTYSKGKIINDLRGRKIETLTKIFPGELSMVISDDFSDLTDHFKKKLFVQKNKIYIETTLESIDLLL